MKLADFLMEQDFATELKSIARSAKVSLFLESNDENVIAYAQNHMHKKEINIEQVSLTIRLKRPSLSGPSISPILSSESMLKRRSISNESTSALASISFFASDKAEEITVEDEERLKDANSKESICPCQIL